MTKYRIVLDTNVYLSGIIFGGNCRHILDLAIRKEVNSITSVPILLEISEKLKNKFDWNKEQIAVTIKSIAKIGKVIIPKIKLNVVKRDMSDNKIIDAGVEGDANFIITGDKHLLEIKKYENIHIISPAQFLSIYFQK